MRGGGPSAAACVLAFGAGLWWAAAQPVYHTDLWGHLAYGRHIAAEGIPQTEPLLPLSDEAMPPSDWLWKWLAFEAVGGGPSVLLLQAVPVAAAAALLAAVAFRRSRSLFGAAVAVGAAWWVVKSHLMVRPQTVGVTLFCATLWLSEGRRLGAAAGAAFVLFAAWANLHGSWVLGLLLLLGQATGDAASAAWRRRSATRRLFVRRAARNGLLAAAAAVAVNLNPDGPAIFRHAAELSAHPNVASFVEWKPLAETPRQRLALLTVLAATAAAAVLLRKRVRLRDVFVVTPLLAKTVAVSRTVLWAGPLVGVEAGRQAAAAVHRLASSTRRRPVFAAAAAAAGVAMTGAGAHQIATAPGSVGDPASLRPVVSTGTPLGGLVALNESGRRGLVWCDQDWGDAALYFCPDAAPVVNSHGHVIPPNVWLIGTRLQGSDRAAEYLDRLRIDTVLTRPRRRAFLRRLEDAGWAVRHRDGRSVLLVRPTVVERDAP